MYFPVMLDLDFYCISGTVPMGNKDLALFILQYSPPPSVSFALILNSLEYKLVSLGSGLAVVAVGGSCCYCICFWAASAATFPHSLSHPGLYLPPLLSVFCVDFSSVTLDFPSLCKPCFNCADVAVCLL